MTEYIKTATTDHLVDESSTHPMSLQKKRKFDMNNTLGNTI